MRAVRSRYFQHGTYCRQIGKLRSLMREIDLGSLNPRLAAQFASQPLDIHLDARSSASSAARRFAASVGQH